MKPLVEFIRAHREEIVDECVRRLAAVHGPDKLPRPVLREHLPELLDRLASAIERDRADLDAASRAHALDRSHQSGSDLQRLTMDYRELRLAITTCYLRSLDEHEAELASTFAPLHRLVDGAIGAAVHFYQREREHEREIFLAVLGHDLRNPLGTMSMGLKAMLSGGRLGAADVSLAQRISSAAERMRELLADLLDFTRARFGAQMPLEPQPLRLDEICRRVLEEAQLAHPGRHFSWASSGTVEGVWDRKRIEQALSNLLENAVFHGEDPIQVTVAEQADDWTIVEVTSRGALGFRPAERAFDPLQRRGRGGTLGLGLFIVREAMRAHGGEATAQDGGGVVTFTLRLPRQRHRGWGTRGGAGASPSARSIA